MVIKGDTRSLDYGSCDVGRPCRSVLQPLRA